MFDASKTRVIGLPYGEKNCRRVVSDCLSVCPVSVTFVYYAETSKRIFKLFLPSGSHTILVFSHKTLWQYSDGKPVMGGRMQCMKKSQFRPISRVASEMIQDIYNGRPIVSHVPSIEQTRWTP